MVTDTAIVQGALQGTLNTTVHIIADYVIIVVGVASVVGFFIAISKGGFRFLRNISNMTHSVNSHMHKTSAFMDEVLPDILSGFEENSLIKKGTLAEWMKVRTRNLTVTHSPVSLNEKGAKLMQDSGMKNVIDENIALFVAQIEESEQNKTPLDVEKLAFYVLKKRENDDCMNIVKNYLYNNPKEEIDTLIFLGGIYLRDKYFEKHPDLLQMQNEKIICEKDNQTVSVNKPEKSEMNP
jgi:hypothetical protein